MRFLFFGIVALVALSHTSFANDGVTTVESQERKVPVKEGYQKLDLNQFKGLDTSQSAGRPGGHFSTGCKSKSGVESKAGDPGYESCLKEIELDQSARDNNGAKPSMSVTFGK